MSGSVLCGGGGGGGGAAGGSTLLPCTVVESSLRRLLGRHTGEGAYPGRDLTAGKTADTRKVSQQAGRQGQPVRGAGRRGGQVVMDLAVTRTLKDD